MANLVSSSVIVGMSGGVDSAVAAALLVQQGYRVRGMFMKNWEEDDGTEYCTAKADLADARRACDQLGIELIEANFAAEYWDDVFAHFLASYTAGLTPNPDVLCNREIKFKQFAEYASELGADYIATGHYARTVVRGGKAQLFKAADQAKDQTYFLQAVSGRQLARCLFPLGGLQKRTVRALAARWHLGNHDKKDSTGICFIGERRFADFLKGYVPAQPGDIRSTEGVTVGRHSGLAYYTPGQRRGLAIGGRADAAEKPWYVVSKSVAENTLVVTQDEDRLHSRWLSATDEHWLDSAPALPLRAQAKVRYRQADQDVTVRRRADGDLYVQFDKPQRAISPGQFVAFYAGERLLGGAVINQAASYRRAA